MREGAEDTARGTARPEAGALIAEHYRLLRRVGEGATGEIWLAGDAQLRTEIALKVLKPKVLADPAKAMELLEQFRFGAQVATLLGTKTQHVVAVHDVGRGEHGPYLAMELVPGQSLLEALSQRGPMDPQALAPLLEAVTDALSAAHAAGIVHRNFKPSNVLLADEAEGRRIVKVSDFGVARRIERDGGLRDIPTKAAADVINAPDYMSPEQLRGGVLDARADVWAVGAVVYQALTGRTPFEAASIHALLLKVMLDPFAPASSVREDLPRALDDWFAKALAKDADDRFASMTDLCAAYFAALDIAPSMRLGGGRGSMESITDPHGRPTLPVVSVSETPEPALEPDTVVSGPGRPRPAPAQAMGTTTTERTPPARPSSHGAKRAVTWGLIAMVLGGLAGALFWGTQRRPGLLRDLLSAPVVTPVDPAHADSVGGADTTGAAASAVRSAGGSASTRTRKPRPAPVADTAAPPPDPARSVSRPPVRSAPQKKPTERGGSDKSNTF